MPSSLDVSPLNSCQGQPRKKTSQQIMQRCKFCCFLLLAVYEPSRNIHKNAKQTHRFWKQNMLFMTCCWKSRPLKENHVEWLGFFKLLGCTHCISPTQCSPFHPRNLMAEPHGLCMNFRVSSKPICTAENWKNSSPDWKAFSHKNYDFSGFAGVVAICRVFAGFLAGRSGRKNNVIVVAFVVSAHHCRQPTKLRGALRSKSCFASYIFTWNTFRTVRLESW